MVEWKKLGEVCEYFRGRSLSKTDIGLGEAKVILYGELYTIYGDYITSVKSKTSTEKAKAATSIQTNDLLLPVSSTTKEAQIGKASVYLGNDNVSLGSDAIILRNAANSAYLMYYLNSLLFEKEKMSCVHGTTIMHLSPKELVDKKIPFPSIEEQARIVGILDTFTSAIDNLKEQIAQRRKQYEHYRDQLLNLEGKPGVEMKKLGEIVVFRNGKGHEKIIIPDGKYIVVNSKFISSDGSVKKYCNEQISPLYVDDILMVMSDVPNGKAIAKCYLVERNNLYTLNQRIGAFHVCDSNVITKYLFYVINRNEQLLQYDNKIDQTNLKKDDILNITIPLPPLQEQQRIVSILDTFEASIQNLEAQLKQREKQYEYYRNKLLTFE